MADPVVIGSDTLQAEIDPFGAELVHLRDSDGRELMSSGNPAFWTGRAPILFPVVGAVAGGMIHVDGTAWPMRKHGFARHSRFDLTQHDADRAVFRLTDSHETRAEYPFAFQLEIDFAVSGARLSITARIGNPGAEPLPASFGFHPAFAWPLPFGRPREAHRVRFAQAESAPLRQLDGDGLIAPAPRQSPLAEGRTINLDDALFVHDALIWDRLQSRAVRYGADDGPALDIAFPDSPMLGIWTKPGADFVCIEPWNGIADPQGHAGDFRRKPSVFEIAPGSEKRIALSITLNG